MKIILKIETMRKRHLLAWALALLPWTGVAQTVLFHTGDSTGYPYRIPAIATAHDGQLVAMSDRRPCGGDIGYGRVDILMRTSRDGGETWTPAVTVLEGTGSGTTTGYGDACLVADRERNELLLVCASGDVPYWSSRPSRPLRMVYTRATYDKRGGTWRWEKPADITGQIYFDVFGGRINGLFMGSGRICQSARVKTGDYYRLYAALATTSGNFVVYSDNFGRTWQALGGSEASPAPQGDEPKCEELPDGSVLLSSRKAGGRYFNIFRYTDVGRAEGSWAEAVDSKQARGGIANESGACNGEILIVPARDAAGRKVDLALQSLPAGPARQNVTIYYKELVTAADYDTPLHFAEDWDGAYRVSRTGSAYSTMTLQADGRIGFFYEEEPGWYQMVYRAQTIEEITKGRYHAR